MQREVILRPRWAPIATDALSEILPTLPQKDVKHAWYLDKNTQFQLYISHFRYSNRI